MDIRLDFQIEKRLFKRLNKEFALSIKKNPNVFKPLFQNELLVELEHSSNYWRIFTGWKKYYLTYHGKQDEFWKFSPLSAKNIKFVQDDNDFRFTLVINRKDKYKLKLITLICDDD